MPIFNSIVQRKYFVILAAMTLMPEHAISEDDIEGLGRLFVDVEQRKARGSKAWYL